MSVHKENSIISKNYDFVGIGGGPAGHRGAIQAVKAGAKTAIIDQRPSLGGVALHSGTVPSKTLREAVLYFGGMRQKHFYGSAYRQKQTIILDDLLLRVDKVRQKEVQVMDDQLLRNQVDVFCGQTNFEDSHTLVVSTLKDGPVERIRGEKILLAVGTVPRRPDNVHFDHEVIFDSTFIVSGKSNAQKLPESLIVLGAGVIGIEYACMFAVLGCRVYLVDRRKELFRFLDQDIYDQLLLALSKSGVRLILEDEIGEVRRNDRNRGEVELRGGRTIEADAVMFAMGRTPCSYKLRLEMTDVQTGKYGNIEVNENYQTAEAHIYAAGDVIGFPPLAPTSAEQGRLAARHAMGLEIHSRPELFPFAIYSIPEISMVGKTEQELIEAEVPYEQGLAFYRDIPKAVIIGDLDGALKILLHRETRKILGVHMIGDLASELLHIGALAINVDATIDLFVDTAFNFPTLAEAYKTAALNGINRLEEGCGESLLTVEAASS